MAPTPGISPRMKASPGDAAGSPALWTCWLACGTSYGDCAEPGDVHGDPGGGAGLGVLEEGGGGAGFDAAFAGGGGGGVLGGGGGGGVVPAAGCDWTRTPAGKCSAQ